MSTERKSGLSRERILDAAASVVADEGQTGLSMRRLAEQLDVWPMAVYHYFRDKDELLDALASRSADELGADPGAGSWPERIHVLLEQAYDAIRADPVGLGARMSQAFLSPGLLRLSEAGMSILEEAGFEPADAAAAWRALWSYTYGSATFRLADTQSESVRAARTAVAALPDDEFPTLLDAGREFADAFASPDAFRSGLDALLAGLQR